MELKMEQNEAENEAKMKPEMSLFWHQNETKIELKSSMK